MNCFSVFPFVSSGIKSFRFTYVYTCSSWQETWSVYTYFVVSKFATQEMLPGVSVNGFSLSGSSFAPSIPQFGLDCVPLDNTTIASHSPIIHQFSSLLYISDHCCTISMPQTLLIQECETFQSIVYIPTYYFSLSNLCLFYPSHPPLVTATLMTSSGLLWALQYLKPDIMIELSGFIILTCCISI